MDQEISDNKGLCKNLCQVGNNEISSNSVSGVVLETVIEINSGETASVSGENGKFGLKVNELGSNNSVDGVRRESVIVINSDEVVSVSGENRESVGKVNNNELGSRKADAGKQLCVVDVKCGGSGGGGGFKEGWEGERVCRICHLSSEGSLENTAVATTSTTTTTVAVDLIHLGCGCKDELGVVHIHCAEAWFKLRGNRMCEICGQSAKNITGVGDNRSMEERNGWRFIGSSSGSSSLERVGVCWPTVQPFVNFLMACFVISLVLLWFLHVNMSL